MFGLIAKPPDWSRPSVAATHIRIGYSMPHRVPTCSMNPTARSTARTGSSSNPKLRARKKKDFGVTRAFDVRIKRWFSTEHRLTLYHVEIVDQAIVHPQPFAMPERVTIRVLHRRSSRSADMREHKSRANMSGEFAQILIVPGWIDAAVENRACGIGVPADAKSIAVCRVRSQSRMQTLIDQRVLGLVQQLFEQQRTA